MRVEEGLAPMRECDRTIKLDGITRNEWRVYMLKNTFTH